MPKGVNKMIDEICDGIYRIKIPFDDIYTAAFLLTSGENAIIFDSGSSDSDAEKYIIPLVSKMGFTPKCIAISHMHDDHCGGMEALKKAYPDAKAVAFSNQKGCTALSDGEVLLGRYTAFNLPGHSDDCMALCDIKTKTLISCDCLQQYGIGKYGTFYTDYSKYLSSVERVRRLNPDMIVASHEFVPLGSIAKGSSVNNFLDECENAAKNISSFAKMHPDMNKEELQNTFVKTFPNLPKISGYTIEMSRE